MPSIALQQWYGERAGRLDEIEASHAAIGGSGPGRRFATLQINQAYAVMLSSQFQGFCRDLHDECVNVFAANVQPGVIQRTVSQLLVMNRKLDRGNPTPANFGEDFSRFGLQNFWDLVRAVHRHVASWRGRLELLNHWRNAIAHQDFNPQRLHGITTLTLNHVRLFRNACNGLSRGFDAVMYNHLSQTFGNAPW